MPSGKVIMIYAIDIINLSYARLNKVPKTYVSMWLIKSNHIDT